MQRNYKPFSSLVFLIALGLILFSAAQIIYRFTLPTDGWMVFTSDSFEEPNWVTWENLVGLSSDLQRGDEIIAVDGNYVEGKATIMPVSKPAGWAAGQQVEMTVLRQGHQQSLQVPITRWTRQSLIHHLLARPEILVGIISSFLLALLVFFTYLRRANIPAAQHLLLIGASFFAINLSGLLPDGLSVQFDLPAFYAAGIFGYLLFPLVLAPSLLAFTLVFPREKDVIARRPGLAGVPYLLGGVVCVLLLIPNTPSMIGWLTTMGMIAAALISLVHTGIVQRDFISQVQFRLALFGLILGLSLMLFVFPTAAEWVSDPWLSDILGGGFHFGFALITVFLAIAILRYRLFEIDQIIQRTLVYAILTIISIGIYILIVGYLGILFQANDNLWLSLIATGVVAVLFAPIREQVSKLVSQLFYGDRDDPYRALANLGEKLEATLEPASALSLTVENVAKSLKLPYAAISLQLNDTKDIVVEYGSAQNELTNFPLSYAAQQIGDLIVASRAPHETLTPPDIRLLTDLARQISISARAVILAADLENARLHLVHEREETRRQIGRDIHDGLGHRLVALSRKVESVKNSEDAPNLNMLNEIQQELATITKQARDIAHHLFPPELELLGLVDALRERAEALPGLITRVHAEEDLRPHITNTVEAALYHIALEALTNIEKHSHANNCQISFRVLKDTSQLRQGILEMSISDDGQGIHEQGSKKSLGLLSMQARAVEIGGSCTVESGQGGGACITIRVPF